MTCTFSRKIKVRMKPDYYGGLLVCPESRRLRGQVISHMQAFNEYPSAVFYINPDTQKLADFLSSVQNQRKVREMNTHQLPVTVMMPVDQIEALYGYDLQFDL